MLPLTRLLLIIWITLLAYHYGKIIGVTKGTVNISCHKAFK